MLAWCGSPSSMKTHLLGIHKITKAIAMRYEEEELEKLKKPDNIINPHDSFKQESLTKNVIDFIIDAWSSPAHLPYLGITAHWLTSKFEPQEVLLNMEELPYPHSVIEIQKHLFDLFYEWGIDSKIIAIVTDNGSNIRKACNNISIGKRIPCAAHTLQLSIGKGLDIIKELIGKCKHLISFLSADKKKQQLKESQIYLLIILKPAIQMLKASLMSNTNSITRKEGEKLEVLCPTIYEWKVIREIVELLNPFEEATRLLSGINYPTIGFTYPIIYNLRERLETEFNLLETRIFFDPRFKSLDFINSQETCNQIINQLKEEYEILKQDNTAKLPDHNDTNKSTTMGNFWKKKNAKITAPIKDEFQHYLNVTELPALKEYDSFSWWFTNKNQYPILHQIAMKYLSIPATSVPSERLFSDTKNLITPQRTRLDSFLINQLIFLKRNRNYVDIFREAE
ncbi:zinc finger BED domain-containing protein 4-like [Rhizophagus irregularis DAOM 181602=DAOM 197198]|nr:zinc finger BED domain-containing protein 4-like [Rhizophagus irregularis DAOM 181602=DAOM 197198]